MRFPDRFQLRDGDIGERGEPQPKQDDRHRKPADRSRDHADFTRQKVWGWIPGYRSLGQDIAVHRDSTADDLPVPLRHDIDADRRGCRGHAVGPRQPRAVCPLRCGVDVEIVDVGDGAHRAEDLQGHVLAG